MAEPTPDHPLQFQTQYIKDLSFENPNAPEVYAALLQNQPELSINIDVGSQHLKERSFEVTLILRVGAELGGRSAFLVELQYGALVEVDPQVPDDHLERLLLTEGPRFIFPFARATVADVTREGGFPPLVINPIDFERFYAHKLQAAQQQAANGKAGDGEPAGEPAAPEEAAPQT